MKAAILTIAVLSLGGCAAPRAMAPAKTISTDLSSLHGDLSRFQDSLGRYQATEQARTAIAAERKDAAGAAVRYALDAQALLAAKSDSDLFALLQAQGRDETARATVVAVAQQPPEVKLPLDKLAETAKATDALAKPKKRKAEVTSLLNFARDVNTSLNAAQAAASKTGDSQ